MAKISLNANEIASQITVRVTIKGYHRFMLKLKLALFFIKLGVRIAGMNYEFKEAEVDPESLCYHE